MQYGRSAPEHPFYPGMAGMDAMDHGAVGLYNLGNTCYMNAVLQCLSSTAPLVDYFISGKHRTSIVSALRSTKSAVGFMPTQPVAFEQQVRRGRGEIVNAFTSVMRDMRSGTVKYVSPEAFWSAFSNVHPAFGKKAQQDAQEFLIYTLNALHEDLKKPNGRRRSTSARRSTSVRLLQNPAESSIITRLMEGQLRYDTVCLSCRKTNHTSEVFTVISLPIPSTVYCTLQDCLDHFFQQDILSWNNTVHCSYCDSFQDAQVKTSLLRAPKILIFHLKRFECRDRIKRKLTTNVRFPLKNLDVSAYSTLPSLKLPKYNLYAVVNHFGDLDWGHYTAYCKNGETQQWNTFDDTRFFNVPESTIQNASAYLLFYTNDSVVL